MSKLVQTGKECLRVTKMNFEQKIREWIKQQNMLSPNMGILVGLSGGADSVALLHVLVNLRAEWALKLAAVHIHHGIRPDAEKDVEFCKKLCKELEVPLYVEYVKVPELARKQGMSEEEAGRQVRYMQFEKYRTELGLDLVAVAHHRNDQAETMLFQLFRGSGLRGLTGIPLKRDCIIRPLMVVSREEIEKYLEEKNVSHVTDSTNAEDVYARNRIRHHILPVAEEIAPGAVDHMNQTAELLQEIKDYMEQETAEFLDRYSEREEGMLSVSVEALQKVHPALQKSVVLEAIAEVLDGRKDITGRHVQSVLSLVVKGGEKSVYLPRGAGVIKSYDKLIFMSAKKQEEDACVGKIEQTKILTIEPDKQYLLSDGSILTTKLYSCDNFCNYLENIPKSDCIKWFDYDKIKGVLSFRRRKQGDYLTVRDDGARKALQDYFVNEKVPKSARNEKMVLADGAHIVWVPGMRISAYYKVTKDTKRILEIHIGGKVNG